MTTGNPILDYLMEFITLKKVIIFTIAYFFIIWISVIIWIIRDISNRTENIFLQILSLLIAFILGPFGILLYLLIRPRKTLFDLYYNEIENNITLLSEEIVNTIGKKNFVLVECPKCHKNISLDFKYCPYCKSKIDVLKIKQNTKKRKKSKEVKNSGKIKKSKKK